MQARGSTTAVFALGLAATLLLVASTGAVVLDGPDDRIDDDVALQPGDNPYAFLDENDELTVDVTEDNPDIDADGVNPDAFSAQDSLFYVTFEGDTHADAWIDHDAEAVTFTVDGEPVETPEDAARLTPEDDAVPVGVEIDTRVIDAVPGDRLIDSISVHAEVAEEPPADEPADGSSGPIVSLEEPSPDVRVFELQSVVGGGQTELDLDGMVVRSDIRLESLSFVRDAPGDVDVRVEGDDERPEDAASTPPGVDALGYYTVEFAEPDQPIREATAELVVDRDLLADAGVDPDDLVAYHDDGDGWEPTGTTVLATDDASVRLAVDSDGFSSFALATESPALDPLEASLSATEVEPGEPVTLDVDVENVGAADSADADVRLDTAETDVDVTREDDATLTAAAGETETVSLTASIDAPGVHDLVVDGDGVREPTTVGTVVVTSEDAPGGEAGDDGSEASVGDGIGEGAADDAETPAEEPAGFDLSDAVGLLALIAIVIATLSLVRRTPR